MKKFKKKKKNAANPHLFFYVGQLVVHSAHLPPLFCLLTCNSIGSSPPLPPRPRRLNLSTET